MFLNHTPLKPKIKHYSLQPGMMLVSGSNKVEEILVGLKVHNFVTADEVYTMFED